MTDDLISRKALLDRIERLKTYAHTDYPKRQVRAADIMQEIKAAPEVKPEDAERKHGRWILDPNGCDWNIPAWVCSECKFKNDMIPVCINGIPIQNPLMFLSSNICPNCGARMDGDGKNAPH